MMDRNSVDPGCQGQERKRPMSHIERVVQITSQLERSIRSGELAPGDCLPSEREFSAQLGVSRGVIREALWCLAGQGLVKSRRGSGTRVEPPNSRPVTAGLSRLLGERDQRLEDLCAVRAVLEPAIAALAAIQRNDEHLARMEKTQAIFRNPRRSLKTYVQADMEFHATLANACGNPIFRIILEPIQELLRESRRQTIGHYGLLFISEPHGRIVDAVRARDPDAASVAMRAHIEIASSQIAELRRAANREESGA
jgi:GntR family transcriptional repressor for pyruvate dehydrogenase complex